MLPRLFLCAFFLSRSLANYPTELPVTGDLESQCRQILRNADVDATGSLSLMEFQSLIRISLYKQDILLCGTKDLVLSSTENEFHNLVCPSPLLQCDVQQEISINAAVAMGVSLVPEQKRTSIPNTLAETCSAITRVARRCAWNVADYSSLDSRDRRLQTGCQEDADRADEDGSGSLTEPEYIAFVEFRLRCPGNVRGSPLLPGLWSSAHCLCPNLSSFCCNKEVDIRQESAAYWSELCEAINTIGVILRRGPGCEAEETSQAPQSVPTSNPTAPPPTIAPVTYPEEFLSCVAKLKDSDLDGDQSLDLSEFTILQACSGGELVNPTIFTALASKTTISVGDAYLETGWTEREQSRLLNICDANACEDAPKLDLCASQLAAADMNADGQLDSKEFKIYLSLITECRDTIDVVEYSLFESARCACQRFTGDIFCCLLSSTIDISSKSQAYRSEICDISSAVLLAVEGEPVCPPTLNPTPAPTRNPQPLPTGAPSPEPTTSPTTTAPITTALPTPELDVEPGCIDSLLSADTNADRELDSSEYWRLLAAIAGCGAGMLEMSVDIGFRSTICTSCVMISPASCCLNANGIDLSALYDFPDSFLSISYAAVICTANRVATQVYDECGPPPTSEPTKETTPNPSSAAISLPTTSEPSLRSELTEAEPTPQPGGTLHPAKILEPSMRPLETLPPSAHPTPPFETEEPSLWPTKAPTAKPSLIFTSSPLPDPVVAALLLKTESCIQDLLSADDGDDLLRPKEYLQFIVEHSGCGLITELSADQHSTFLELACLCLNDPTRFTRQCCNRQNAAVNIEGAGKPRDVRTTEEHNALRQVCDKSLSVIPATCANPPTPAPVRPPPTTSPVRPIPTQSPASQSPESSSPVDKPVANQLIQPPLTVFEESPFCSSSLDASDADVDGYLNETEFLMLVRELSQCQLVEELTFRQRSLFLTFACECSLVGNLSDRCCSTDPKIALSNESRNGALSPMNSVKRARICSDTTAILEATCLSAEDYKIEKCAAEIAEADDGDNQLTSQEFSRFIRSYSGCQSPGNVSADYAEVGAFFSLSCSDAGFSGHSVGRCLRNPTINVSGVSLHRNERSSQQKTRITQLCTSSGGLIDKDQDCSIPAPKPPTDVEDGCVTSLRSVDKNGDGRLNMVEFFMFLQKRSPECSGLQEPTAAQRAIFSLISCSCTFSTGNILCCLNGAARIDLDGALIAANERTIDQQRYLSLVCKAPDVTKFSCTKPPRPPIFIPPEEPTRRRSSARKPGLVLFLLLLVVVFVDIERS